MASVSSCLIQTFRDISGACCLILFIHFFYPDVFFSDNLNWCKSLEGLYSNPPSQVSPFSCLLNLNESAKPMYINNIASVHCAFRCNVVAVSDRLYFAILSNIILNGYQLSIWKDPPTRCSSGPCPAPSINRCCS